MTAQIAAPGDPLRRKSSSDAPLFVLWSKDESKPSTICVRLFLRARWGRTGTMIK